MIIIPISAAISLVTFRQFFCGCQSSKIAAVKFGVSTGLGLSCCLPLYRTKVYWITLTAFPLFLCLVFSMLALLFSFAIRNADRKQSNNDKEQRDSIDAATHRE
jgi:hypothetical protein